MRGSERWALSLGLVLGTGCAAWPPGAGASDPGTDGEVAAEAPPPDERDAPVAAPGDVSTSPARAVAGGPEDGDASPESNAAVTAPDPADEDRPREVAVEAPEAEPPLPWLARGGPARVLIVGDSMAATDFGRALGRHLEEHADVSVQRRGKSSTGLARPDYFDWFEEGERLTQRFRPDLVVIVIGGNDGQDLRPKTEGRWVHWRSDGWPQAYRDRTHAFLDAMAHPKRRFVWIELPAMAHRRLEHKLKTIRAVQSEALGTRDDVLAEIPGRPCFYDGDRFLETVPEGPDAGAPMRQDDGIHFTVAGARHYAACVGPAIATFLPPRPLSDDAS